MNSMSLVEFGLVFAGPALMVLGLILAAYKSRSVQSVLGFLWELGTFWPRTGHPLAPPCYAARTVPELVVRVNQLARSGADAGVVLVGHGNGSVLAVATVLQLPPAARERVALLTAGSPVSRLHARLFPEYFHEGTFADVARALDTGEGTPRWINLWRRTDPISLEIRGIHIGSRQVFVDRKLRDPTSFEIGEDGRYPPILGHAWYPGDPEFARAVGDLAATLVPRLRTTGPASPTGDRARAT